MYTKPTVAFSIFLLILSACSNNSAEKTEGKNDPAKTTDHDIRIKEEAVTYTSANTNMKGFVAYDEKKVGPRPIVLVVHEWWGLTDYPRMRAKMLAELGYFAMAVDMYGDGQTADNPKDAQAASMPFYTDPQMAKERLDAALAKAKSYPQADSAKVVAIGYCFGGAMVLNYAKMGAPMAGVVSFHGGLEGVPPQKGTKTQFLICHGGADNYVPQEQVQAFKKSMDSAGIAYTFKVYDSALHAFTNPAATEKGQQFNLSIKYNGGADTASWNDMKAFFNRILQ